MQRSDEEIYEEQERRRIKARRERRRKRRKQQIIFRAVTFTVFFLVLLLIVMLVRKVADKSAAEETMVSEPVKYVEESPDFAVELLSVNEYSRPGTELSQVNGIVVHYTANPGTTANRTAVILKVWQRQGRRMPAAILSLESVGKSFSAFHVMRSLMHPMTETAIPFR